ncbi:SRPBCC domain-containing protein [Amycolatopsis sp. OK19-0408]|uniref:SRPBCC domain-containing protein n=1 Tax=Amycolatopsis iheyensis TaxID=2945988 RepID=A0A9X2N4T6_9PSEU|nr:SRPBCC domain-containing protein [Amycolatopsis iheyensis]MCR6482326.1 SRPBCC domain-containing protein [Amycolatopsis iheyensis]
MTKEFEVGFEGRLPATPAACWRAITVDAGSWSWPITYEPWVGGRETGLTFHGGEVTAWRPHEHFATRCDQDDWFNRLDYTFEPDGDGTYLKFAHRGVFLDDWDTNYDACRRHTAFYYHSLGEYLAHFAGREVTYAMTEAPESSAAADGFTRLKKALGIREDVQVGEHAAGGVVDYAAAGFVGVRTEHSLLRLYGRNAFGWPIGVGRHHFAPIDAAAEERGWAARLAEIFA